MKRKEIDKALRRMKIRIKSGSIQGWAKSRVIPGPTTGSKRYADWSDWTPAEAAAATHLIHKRGWLKRRVAHQRLFFSDALEANRSCFPQLDHWLLRGEKESYRLGFEWLLAVLKARCELPVDQPATVTEVEDMKTGTVRYVAGKPAMLRGRKDAHPREVDRLLSATR